jgi:transcription elongation factor Elf1
MAKAKRAKAKAEPKTLKLVCKCGACTHWEILLTHVGGSRERESIKCMTCGTEISCYFSTGPHEGLHYERQSKNEK